MIDTHHRQARLGSSIVQFVRGAVSVRARAIAKFGCGGRRADVIDMPRLISVEGVSKVLVYQL
jgi:hypothetical protein